MDSIIEWDGFMSMSSVSRFLKISYIEGVNMIYGCSICGWRPNFLKYSSKEVMYHWRCFSFDISTIYLPVRLLICPVWSLINTSLFLITRALRWKYGICYPSPRQKDITRSWSLGPIPPSWGLTEKTTLIRRSKYTVIVHVSNESDTWCWCFWCWDGGIFNKMNSECSWEYFKFVSIALMYLEWVSSGRINLVIS